MKLFLSNNNHFSCIIFFYLFCIIEIYFFKRSSILKIASRIIDLRTQAGLTRYALSQRTGIPQSQLLEYESGDTVPTIRLLEKITQALGCTLSEFFNDDQSVFYLSEKERVLLLHYRTLTLSQQSVVNHVIDEFNSKQH